LKKLPAIIEDAMQFQFALLMLGQRYLWVDSVRFWELYVVHPANTDRFVFPKTTMKTNGVK
jgi:hypothetical protein